MKKSKWNLSFTKLKKIMTYLRACTSQLKRAIPFKNFNLSAIHYLILVRNVLFCMWNSWTTLAYRLKLTRRKQSRRFAFLFSTKSSDGWWMDLNHKIHWKGVLEWVNFWLCCMVLWHCRQVIEIFREFFGYENCASVWKLWHGYWPLVPIAILDYFNNIRWCLYDVRATFL